MSAHLITETQSQAHLFFEISLSPTPCGTKFTFMVPDEVADYFPTQSDGQVEIESTSIIGYNGESETDQAVIVFLDDPRMDGNTLTTESVPCIITPGTHKQIQQLAAYLETTPLRNPIGNPCSWKTTWNGLNVVVNVTEPAGTQRWLMTVNSTNGTCLVDIANPYDIETVRNLHQVLAKIQRSLPQAVRLEQNMGQGSNVKPYAMLTIPVERLYKISMTTDRYKLHIPGTPNSCSLLLYQENIIGSPLGTSLNGKEIYYVETYNYDPTYGVITSALTPITGETYTALCRIHRIIKENPIPIPLLNNPLTVQQWLGLNVLFYYRNGVTDVCLPINGEIAYLTDLFRVDTLKVAAQVADKLEAAYKKHMNAQEED